MCGFCGTLDLRLERPASEPVLRRMAHVMRHRGPDDEGFLLDGPLGFGHRRLSIIDLAGGHQPLSNEDGRVWIAYNGEIYNYEDLQRDLKAKGHRFRTRSDTETIVHLYEEYGDAFVERLRGMFAFALWDGRRQRLLLVRDPVGIKPVYYAVQDDVLTFGSEIKPILLNEGVPRELNEDALESYLGLRYTPGGDDGQTMFRGIHKLPAGSLLVAEAGEVRVRSYWDLAFRPNPELQGPREWAAAFRTELEKAVEMRLMSEVPLGGFLSGGIDSSVTVAIMSGLMSEPVRSFSVGYADRPDVSEFPYARLVADRYRTDHRELEITAGDYWSHVPRMVWHLDEPVADYACLPLMLMAELTREHVTVILSGEGADELLAGYSLYRKMQSVERARRIPGWNLLARAAGGFLPEGKLRRYVRASRFPLESRYRGISTGFAPDEARAVLPALRDRPDGLAELARAVFARSGTSDPLHRMLYFDTRVYLVDDLLIKADKMTMAASLELRVPFLDHRLMELAASMPPEAKLDGSTSKRVLRDVARTLLPEEILTRPKKGFPVPIEQWLAKELEGPVRETLLERGGPLDGLFDLREVGRILDRHAAGTEDCSARIWTLLVLDQWKRIFIDSSELPDLGPPAVDAVGLRSPAVDATGA